MNKKLNLKLSNYFFIISCSIITLLFSISVSSITEEIKKYKINNPKYNKQITFPDKSNIYLNDLYEILKDRNITIKLQKYREDDMIVETYLNINDMFYNQYIESTELISLKHFRENTNWVIFSNTFNGNKTLDIKLENGIIKNIHLDEFGKIYSNEGKMIINNHLFNQYIKNKSLSEKDINIVLSGDEKEIQNCIKIIQNSLLNSNTTLKINDYFSYDTSTEWKGLIFSLILIFLISFLNTIGISYFLVKNIEKEIIIKKVVGASNFNIIKEFFLYFNKIAIKSFFIAIISHLALNFISNGYLGNMKISMNFFNLLMSFIFIITFSIISIIPFLVYIIKIEPVLITRRN